MTSIGCHCEEENMTKTKIVGLMLGIVIIVGMCFVPGSGALTVAGVRTIGIMLAFIVLLVSEALPIMYTCLICLGLMPLLKITPSFPAALVGFAHPVMFFIIGSFGIATAFSEVPLSKRLLIALLKIFGKNIRSMIFAIMLVCAIISSLVSNVPTCALGMSIALSFLELYSNGDEKKRTGRTLMIAIPVASMIGGMMTPAGSSHNLLAISLLEQYAGQNITFIQWMAAGIPLTIIALPLAWLVICGINKPAEIDPVIVKSFINNIEIPKKMSSGEIKTLAITLIMLTLWILSSWIRSINVMVVALLGSCALCLPGIGVYPFKKYAASINWEAMVLIGTVFSFGPTMVTNKVSDWVITLIPSISLSAPILIGFVSLVAFMLLIFIPIGSTLLIIMSLPFITLATVTGVSPVYVMFAFGIVSTQCFLLPLDVVPLLTYSTGYYSMKDMAKTTVWLQLGMVVLLSLWTPIIGKILGF